MSNSPNESYDYDEPTPADRTITTADGVFIIRMGEPPIPVGCGATCADDIPADEAWGGAQ